MWGQNLMHGRGQIIFQNKNEHFKGQFKIGRYFYGSYYFEDGSYFEGEYINDSVNVGKLQCVNGEKYDGVLKNGNFFTEGTFIDKGGQKFTVKSA
jgi:hypothetical protein